MAVVVNKGGWMDSHWEYLKGQGVDRGGKRGAKAKAQVPDT